MNGAVATGDDENVGTIAVELLGRVCERAERLWIVGPARSGEDRCDDLA
jgi:hypothetical protein